MDPMLPSDAFRLGSVTVVPSLNRLVWADRAEDLEPRVMRVLAVLAETPGEVVARGDLLDAVWGETVVNEDALTRAVSELRKALGGESDVVETIRGHGYRLKVPVRALPQAPLGSPAPPVAAQDAARPPASQVAGAPRRPGALALVTLGVAVTALAVALWAARSEAPEAADTGTQLAPSDQPFRLDSTSPFYRPGMSELGVYYDSARGRHFRFESGDSSGGGTLDPAL